MIEEEILNIFPEIEVLQWLARGSLKQNLPRAIRLWVELRSLYGEEEVRLKLPNPFTFPDWRDAFFSSTHPKGENPQFHDSGCACAKTTREWLFSVEGGISEAEWRRSLQQHDAISDAILDELLQRRLFAVTRRSLQGDLYVISELGWLQRQGQKYYRAMQFPPLPLSRSTHSQGDFFSRDRFTFLHPDLEWTVQNFSDRSLQGQRFFLEVDYIVGQTRQDRVEDWQQQLKQLWQSSPIALVQLTYRSAKVGEPVQCIVYPVCLYYVRRSLYLCAFGATPTQQGEWYNYRLDRISSMTALNWEAVAIPQSLRECYPDRLPTPDTVRAQMELAWGFDFYEPAQPLLLRFEREFHDRYIQGTFRHDTFKPVTYRKAKQLIRSETPKQHQKELLAVLEARSPDDAYYSARVRRGDPNVLQRLRAWRPHGEVLLPWELRQDLAKEVAREAQLYL